MVKGVSRQVIVLQSPDPNLFEQAIFILRESRPEVTDEELLEHAKHLIRENRGRRQGMPLLHGSIYALCGALCMGIIWFVSVIL